MRDDFDESVELVLGGARGDVAFECGVFAGDVAFEFGAFAGEVDA
ncbi:hypothetical protein WJ972_17780 [Achromobacter insuavis]